MKITKFSMVLTALLVANATAPVMAQDFPKLPIRIIVPFSAGGPTDAAARILADRMGKEVSVPVIVENKGGAASIIATEFVANAPNDGHTILVASNQATTNHLVYKKVPYKISDFEPVSLLYKAPLALTVSKDLPVSNVSQFVAYARKNPDKINYAILGPGGSPHILAKSLEAAAGIKMVDVSYKESAPAIQDMMQGAIQLYFNSVISSLPLHNSGHVKIIGIVNDKRLDAAPNIPTLAEQGYPISLVPWFGFLVPKGTPKDRIALLNKITVNAVNSSEFKDVMTKFGSVPQSSTPEELSAFIAKDTEAWGDVIRPLHLQLE